jgi:hypothetical protein
MPYRLQKDGMGYVVKNVVSGKVFSRHPLPKKRAEAQLRLLEMIEHHKR